LLPLILPEFLSLLSFLNPDPSGAILGFAQEIARYVVGRASEVRVRGLKLGLELVLREELG
jgi:hypothetical protein